MGIDIRHGNIFWEEEGISDSARGGYGSLFTHEIFVSQNDNVWASILCTAEPGLRCFTLYFSCHLESIDRPPCGTALLPSKRARSKCQPNTTQKYFLCCL